MRVLFLLAVLVALAGCASPEDALDANAFDPSGPTPPAQGAACGFTVRAEPETFAVGENATVIASYRNCGRDVARWTDSDGCGFGPRLDARGEVWHLDGAARRNVACTMALVEHEVAPGDTLEARGAWNGTFLEEASWRVAEAGVYRVWARAGMGGEHGPQHDAEAAVTLLQTR